MTPQDGIMMHVALSIHNPIYIDCDLDDWTAKGILDAASMNLTKIPFKSPSSMYIYEQKKISKAANKILRILEIDKGFALKTKSLLE